MSDTPVAKTIEAGEGRLVDLDDAGNVVVIEILCASEGFQLPTSPSATGYPTSCTNSSLEHNKRATVLSATRAFAKPALVPFGH
jgi:uncharacterized protein YuzE